MENVIFSLSGDNSTRSIVVTQDEFWISPSSISNLDKFKAEVENTGMMKKAYSHKLSFIREINFADASDTVKLKYYDEKKTSQKTLTLDFSDKVEANKFSHFLGQKIEFSKSETQENKTKQLLMSLLYLVLTIGGTIFLAGLEGTDELSNSGSRRTRGKGAFLQMIVDTVGQTGVYIIGGLISLYLAYQMYNRFQSPATEVAYKKSK